MLSNVRWVPACSPVEELVEGLFTNRVERYRPSGNEPKRNSFVLINFNYNPTCRFAAVSQAEKNKYGMLSS